jgi:hypothetical protein
MTSFTAQFAHPTPAEVSTRGRDAAVVTKARARAPQPTLFGAGDLPPFLASGIDPRALLSVPWQARHTLAAAPTPAAAYAVTSDFAGLSAEDAAAYAALYYSDHPGTRDYANRVEEWLVDGQYGPAPGR